MAFRFRRSIKIMPGVRVNVSKSGLTTSIGPRGASVNIGPKQTSATVGIPGTGISYKTGNLGQSSAATAPDKRHIAEINHVISSNEAGEDTHHRTEPAETVYRIAAIVAAVLIGNANKDAAAVRIAGVLPEQLPTGESGPHFALRLLSMLEGRSTGNAAFVRKVIENAGLLDTHYVNEAVAAARAAHKVKFKSGLAGDDPVEWLIKSGNVECREFEAPSVRMRIPAESLDSLHIRQIEIGNARMANPKLLKGPRSHFGAIVFGILLMIIMASFAAAWLIK